MKKSVWHFHLPPRGIGKAQQGVEEIVKKRQNTERKKGNYPRPEDSEIMGRGWKEGRAENGVTEKISKKKTKKKIRRGELALKTGITT